MKHINGEKPVPLFLDANEGRGGNANATVDTDLVIGKLDEIQKSNDDKFEKASKDIQKAGDDVKTVSEKVSEIEDQQKQMSQNIAELKSTAVEVAGFDNSERAVYKNMGAELAYSMSQSTSDKIKGYWDTMQAKKQVDTDSALFKSMDPKSNTGGIILQPTVRERIDSVQIQYGVIRQNVEQTPMGNELVYFGEQKRVNPDVNSEIKNGCCGNCPLIEDLEGWVESRISPAKFTRYVCVPTEMIQDANFDIIGRYVVRVLGEKFRFIEDQMGFATIIQNPSLVQHVIGGTGFEDLTWDDIVKLPFLNEVLGAPNARVWLNRTNLQQLMLEKGTDGHYIALAMALSLQARFPGGNGMDSPDMSSVFGEANVLPRLSESAPDTKFSLYGDLNSLLVWGVADDARLRMTDQHNWPCDVVTVGLTARYAFGVPDANSSLVGVALKTAT